MKTTVIAQRILVNKINIHVIYTASISPVKTVEEIYRSSVVKYLRVFYEAALQALSQKDY